MASLAKNASLQDFQTLIRDIYGVPDDRLFSLSDLISNLERFTMRSLKGIRKEDVNKIELNLLVAFSWLMAIANRLHLDMDKIVIERFPYICSYCLKCPCICKKKKFQKRKKAVINNVIPPQTIAELQTMFEKIYPASSRSLSAAGVHLAEEIGELSESCHIYQGEHKQRQFLSICTEAADYVSCLFGVANSANINILNALVEMYKNNCHICHKSPCVCNFSYIAQYSS